MDFGLSLIVFLTALIGISYYLAECRKDIRRAVHRLDLRRGLVRNWRLDEPEEIINGR